MNCTLKMASFIMLYIFYQYYKNGLKKTAQFTWPNHDFIADPLYDILTVSAPTLPRRWCSAQTKTKAN